jgi:hypothetical protein
MAGDDGKWLGRCECLVDAGGGCAALDVSFASIELEVPEDDHRGIGGNDLRAFGAALVDA